MPAPTLTTKAARSAAKRMTAQRLVRTAGVALTVTLGAVTLGVLADRLIGPGLEQHLSTSTPPSEPTTPWVCATR